MSPDLCCFFKAQSFSSFFWVTERALFSITSPLHYKYLTFSVNSKCPNVHVNRKLIIIQIR